MFERFTDRARKVLALANQEAQRLNHEYIGTEHILLGLVKEGSGVAASVLKNLDVDIKKVRVELEKRIRPGAQSSSPGKLPQTPAAKSVIQHAVEEARSLSHNYVGTEHLLLGLLYDREGMGGLVLSNLKISLEEVRKAILDLLGVHEESESAASGAKAEPSGRETVLPSRIGPATAAPIPALSAYERGHSVSLLREFEIKIKPNTSFVLLPSGEDFDRILENAIRPALAANGVDVERAEVILEPGAGLQRTWRLLRTAEIILADVSGFDADVMFGLGLCLGLGRFPILLVRYANSLPSDFRAVPHIPYKADTAGTTALRGELTTAIREFLRTARA